MNLKEEYLAELKKEEKEKLSVNQELIENFKLISKKNGFIPSSFTYTPAIGTLANEAEIVTKLNPNIERDKEGLVSCSLLEKYFTKNRFISGYLYSTNYMIMAHPYFRRGYHNNSNFHPMFMELFWNLSNPDIEAYLAIDFNRVRINVDNSHYVERDMVYGAKFNRTIKDIKDEVIKLKPPIDLDEAMISIFFNDIYALDIMWETTKKDDNIRVFKLEEFKTESVIMNVDEVDYYPVRYVHAEFDIENGYFRHFDGAIQLYTKEEYDLRRDKNLGYNSKGKNQIKPKSIKIFKLNGKVSVDLWVKFVNYFLSKNPLTIEYFSGEFPQVIQDKINKFRSL